MEYLLEEFTTRTH